MTRSTRYGRPFTLVVLDVDGFKSVNDRHGHLAGDAALERFGLVLRAGLRAADTAYRIGGDEFALLLPETSAPEARAVIERIAEDLEGAGDQAGMPLRASFGVIVGEGGLTDAERLLRGADAAMYEAKRTGAHIHFVHDPRTTAMTLTIPKRSAAPRVPRGDRVVRSEEELGGLLASIAKSISESLGFVTVTVHLHRPAWDDFEVTTVHGSDEAVESLMGDARGREVWEPLLDERFARRGAYHVPHGEFDWETHAPGSYVPPVAAGSAPDDWHPLDALFVPLRHADGHLIGILSVDEPVSGRIPTDEELDVLVAMADHAAIAVQSAQEAEQAARHRAALEQLLQVSSRLTETFAIDEILQSVCEGIHTALGFENVCIDLPEPDTDGFRTRAARGCALGDPAVSSAMPFAQIERLLDPQFEVEGCYLPDHQQGPSGSAPSTTPTSRCELWSAGRSRGATTGSSSPSGAAPARSWARSGPTTRRTD
jgi:diguanylate cyclase (GGDEF)-like protein